MYIADGEVDNCIHTHICLYVFQTLGDFKERKNTTLMEVCLWYNFEHFLLVHPYQDIFGIFHTWLKKIINVNISMGEYKNSRIDIIKIVEYSKNVFTKMVNRCK